MKAHYSGPLSKSFWKKVNNIKRESDRQEIYSLGVALQNFEGYVLRQYKMIQMDRKNK